MSEHENIGDKYPKGYHEVTITEFEEIKRAYKGKVMSPRAVSLELGVSKEQVVERAKEGKIRYFSISYKHGFVPVEDVYEWKQELESTDDRPEM